MPKLRSIVVSCADARVDPAHIAGLALGEALVIRNTGGRVTPEVIGEIATVAFLAAKMSGNPAPPMEVIVIQHSDCGGERLANPALQQALREQIGVDVGDIAIADHDACLHDDVERLRNAEVVPGHIVVSAFLYELAEGRLREVVAPAPLRPVS